MSQIGDTYHAFEIPIYNAPTLCLPLIDGITAPANQVPDTGTTDGICIPIHLTGLSGPVTEQLQTTSTIPLIGVNNQAYGGQMGTFAAKAIPRLSLEGYIDTPSQQYGPFDFSLLVDFHGFRYHYTEIIAMMIEGRANVSGFGWGKVDPLWFRDPYGRVFVNPQILDFQASFVAGVPERAQFTMVLKV